MYFPKAARFEDKSKLVKTQVVSASSYAIPSIFKNSPAKKPATKTADEKSFEDFMNLVQDNFKAIRQANKAKEEYLKETEKESKKAHKTKEIPEKERLALHGGMFVRLIGSAACTELGPGTYEQHNQTLERKGYNIMEVNKALQRKSNPIERPRNKSKC